MSATPPEASSEYSRGQGPSELVAQLLGWRRPPVHEGFSAALRTSILGATLLGALLLVVSEFTTLFTIHVVGASAPIKSVSTGSHDSYALILVAALAVVLAWAAVSTGNRWALVALVGVGIATLLIALIGDLPDAQASGTVGSLQAGFKSATNQPSAGLYLETLGAIMLIIAGGCGLLLGAPGGTVGPQTDIKSDDDLAP